MFRHLISLLLVGLWLVGSAFAQSNRVLEYGQAVEDRITNERFEVTYDFKGREGDFVLFDLVATESQSDLSSPEMVLFDRDGEPILDTLRHFDTRRARLMLPLPYTGAYELLITRRDGRAGDDEGDFRLRALQPPVLAPGETINDAVLNNRTTNYYLVQQDIPFSVRYEFSNGDFNPTIEGFRVEAGELIPVATLRGRGLLSGALGLDGNAAEAHVIALGGSLYGRVPAEDDVERADYRLRLDVTE